MLTDVIIASLLPEGSISFLYFADRVNQLPLGVIGDCRRHRTRSRSSRAKWRPMMHVRRQQQSEPRDRGRAVSHAARHRRPLLVLALPVVSVLFQRGAFDAVGQYAATAFALDGLRRWACPPTCSSRSSTPGYFARKDTRTPVRIAIVAMVVNLVLNLILIWPLQHVGLALATALAAWLNAGLLASGLLRRGHWTLDARLRGRLVRIVSVTVIMTAVLWVARDALAASGWLDSRGARIGALAGLVVLGLVVYGAAAQISGAMRVAELRTLLRRPGPST